MMSLIMATSPRKIRSLISGDASMISIAATRPILFSRGISRCEIIAVMFSDRSMSSWCRRSSGKKLMMRSSAWFALFACSVATQRWPGLRELDRVLHRLLIADLADHDDVGRLAQRVLQRVVPVVGVDADLAVRDDAAAVRVDVLDGILDRDDVAAAVLVAIADHRRERRRLTGARAADDEA